MLEYIKKGCYICLIKRKETLKMHRNIRFETNLANLRNARGLSQQAVAEVINVSRQTISAWERGVGKPDVYSLHDVCKFFDVSLNAMMYSNILCANECESVKEESMQLEDSICSCAKRGYYTFFEEDLNEFFGVIYFDIIKISIIAISLHKKGYLITEVFDNGFAVYFRTDKEATNFQNDLYDIIEEIIHHDNYEMEKQRSFAEDVVNKAYCTVLDKAMEMIYGATPREFTYYWVDEMGNPRGYAFAKEECVMQAQNQECSKYTILSRVE